jgi:hypothetical protein
MAKRKINKSKKIREAFAELGDVGPKAVVEHLAAKKIKVSYPLVAAAKQRLKGGATKPKGKPGRKPKANGHISLAALLTAKSLVNEAGSVEAAKKTLAALSQLQ